jgi:hypothetical protein
MVAHRRPAVAVAVFAAVTTLLIAATGALAAHPDRAGTQALEAAWAVPVASGAIGDAIDASVELRAAEPLRGVVLTVTATGPIALGGSARQDLGDLPAGARTAGVPFTVTGEGRGTLHAEATALDAAGVRVTAAVEIDVATGAGRVAVSRNGMLDAREAALGFERPKIGEAAYARRLAALRSGGAEQEISTSGPAPALPPPTTAISGTIRYTASNGSLHPARTIRVQVNDADGTPNGALLKALVTDATGHYSTTIPTLRGNGQPRRPFVKAFAQGEGFQVKGVGATTAHVIASTPVTANGVARTINLVANKVDDNNTAFGVADALTSAIAYTKRVNGGATFGSITASFPNANGTDFNSSTGVARILKLDRFDWDVLLHEYGHFIAAKLAIDSSPGGAHSFSDNLGETRGSKDAGVKVAWSEGFATWFAITSENVLGVQAMKIPKAGDTFYDDTEDAAFHVPLATNGVFASKGEDNELSAGRTLWHIFSDPAIDMADTTMISTLKTAAAVTLSDAVAALMPADAAAKFDDSEPVDAAKVGHANDFGCLLVSQAVAPKVLAPATGAFFKPDKAPAFKWQPNGAGPSNRLNSFTVQFWSQNWDTKLFESPATANATYTPTEAEWKQIVEAKDKGGVVPTKMNVVVKGSNSTAPASGPYKSCKIVISILPAIKTRPVQAFLAPLSPSFGCSGVIPPDLNQFFLTATRMKANTQYALRFSLAGRPDIALGNVTSDANGMITDQRVSIPEMPAHPKWPLIARPATGSSAKTEVFVSWYTCIKWDRFAPDFQVSWGGAGVKPSTVVTEAWNGVQQSATTAGATGLYDGSYQMHCPASLNTVTVTATTLTGPSTITFPNSIDCTPALRGGDTTGLEGMVVFGEPPPE